MEIDALVRAPAAFARAAGLSTPMLDMLAGLAIRQARDKGLYKGGVQWLLRDGAARGPSRDFGLVDSTRSASPLPLWERSDRTGDAKHQRCDPGEGLRRIDRPEPLTPTLSQSKSDISDFDELICPTRVNPSWVGEGARCGCRTVEAMLQSK